MAVNEEVFINKAEDSQLVSYLEFNVPFQHKYSYIRD